MMRKFKGLLLFLTLCILTVQGVSAYELNSWQSQEINSESEMKMGSSSSFSSSTEVFQEQSQYSTMPSDDDDTVTREVHTTTKTVRQRPTYKDNLAESGKNGRLKKVTQEEIDLDKGETATSTKPPVQCSEIKGRLVTHVEAFAKNYQQREDKFKRIYQTISELATRLENKGVDASQLQAAATKLQTERAQLLTAADAYSSKAEEISELSCDAPSGDRRARFAELRAARQAYEQELRDVRQVINMDLKQALQELRSNTQSN